MKYSWLLGFSHFLSEGRFVIIVWSHPKNIKCVTKTFGHKP